MGDFKPAAVWSQDAEAHVSVIDALLAGKGAIKHGWMSDNGILGMPAQVIATMGGMPSAEDACAEAIQILKRMEVEDTRLSFVDKSLVETLRRVLYNISVSQSVTTHPTTGSTGPTGASRPATVKASAKREFWRRVAEKIRRSTCAPRALNAQASTSHRLKLLPRR